MAAEAVALAALGAFLQVLFNKMASRRFEDFITRQKLDDGLLNNLEISLNSVKYVLDDAEEKEIKEPNVKEWLDHLKNAFFEADDLLDEIDYEATRLEREAESRSAIDEVHKFLRPRKSFKKGLRKILKTIQELVNQKHVFGLRENMEGAQRMHTTSVETSNIFGRVPDREAIMEVLLSDDVNRSNNLSIISIVGLGGIGKTTLAQLIYNDERVQNRFGTVRGWVCVSEKFDFQRLPTDIAKSLAKIDCNGKTPDQIQVDLMEKLKGKRFLLVLDDVWDEILIYLEQLLAPLKSGGPGSTIIITTRNDVVATTVRSSIFRLHKLDSTDCWQLFCKEAFGDPKPQDYTHLEKIGQKIVEKCDGLPLAVKVMGGVLCNNRDARYWEKVLKNDLWKIFKDGILPVLRLSYRYLPSYLKQCFAYCSIFPKDYEFEKEQLILLWMAEGFLIVQKENVTMEEVGEKYFEELVSRSFFQHATNNSFVMHDLINDLAGAVAGDFCFRFENQEICRTFERLRYFSFRMVEEESSSRQLLTILKSHVLRTFLPVYVTISGQMLQEMIPDLFLNQQQLRVLSLSQCKNLVELPSSISGLKHLRYLDLSRTSIESLPESLCSFYNLQTLKLWWCTRLAKLPTKMGRMISMRYLDIEFTKLQDMPPNMGKLIKLQTLTDFFVGKWEGCGVKELGSLRHLGGTLRIHNLQNVVNTKDALEANIKCKKNLKKLELCWDRYADDPQHEEAVLDGLEPHTEIEVISIDGYGGTSFPNWLESGAFPCLKKLRLIFCRNLKGTVPSHLPSSAKLEIDYCPQLQICYSNAPNISSLGLIIVHQSHFDGWYFGSSIYLGIRNMKESVLEKIGQLGSSFEEITIAKHEPLKCFSLELFPELKSLKIEDCPHFESFCLPNQKIVSLEFLTELILKDCPKLKCLPERMRSLLPALLTLEIIRCPEIEIFSGDGLPLKLESLTISNCNKLIAGRMHWDLQKLTSLTSFSIEDYEEEEMDCFPEVTLLPSALTSLEICDLPYLKSLNSEGLQHFDSLKKLKINYCLRLQLMPDEGLPSTLTHLTRLRELHISNCPEIASLPEEGLPRNLITLMLCNLLNLISVEGLRHLTSLESLTIEGCPYLKTLPEEGLPSSLRALCIHNCPEIASLPEESLPPNLITLELFRLLNLRSVEGLHYLTSLKSLTISGCPHLKTLLEEGLPSSLRELDISNCPEIASLSEEGLPPSLISLSLYTLQNLRFVKGLCRLTSLKELSIWNCPHLKTLPEECLPSSLSSLNVLECPLLKKRYTTKKGKYWAKISQIPHIDIR